ncbi:MAG TPA: ferrochelatase [Deltaproteobacteria bacterium]|nr:ferrochelatase [Deltaproteobacteria bacterium]
MARAARATGVLLLNLGTPASPSVPDVRRYLAEFLSDPRVLDLPAPARWLLLHLWILRFRPHRSAAQYASVWKAEGSPLLVHSRALCAALSKELGASFEVTLAMRYGTPGIAAAMEHLLHADVGKIIVFPLFPQGASSSRGSALAKVFELAGAMWNVAALDTAPEFYDDPSFMNAWKAVIEPRLAEFHPDHVLFSFHGLPERHLRKSDPTERHCLATADCCDAIGPANRACYRAQCAATTRALASALALAPDTHSMAFQSRLGREPWIRPYTDRVLPELHSRGVRRLAVVCPSFVADCLETVEEIGIRAREQWKALGGAELLLVPSLNADPAWVGALAQMVRNQKR